MSRPSWRDAILFTLVPLAVSVVTIGIALLGIGVGLQSHRGLLVYIASLLLLAAATGFMFAHPRFRNRWFVLAPAMVSVLAITGALFVLTIATGRLTPDALWPSGLLFFVIIGIFVDTVVLQGLQARPLIITEGGFRPPGVPKMRILRGKSFIRFAEVKESKHFSLEAGEKGMAIRLADGSVIILRKSEGASEEFMERLARLPNR